jgi:putative hydrolase of the HAD superfamily
MAIPAFGTKNNIPGCFEAILFDMNGTLRERVPDETVQQAATARMFEMLKKEEASNEFWEELTRRYNTYNQWAQENLVQLSEGEIWTRWILPDLPREQVEPLAADLSLAWSEHKGRMIPKQGAEEILFELKKRGYRLGVISNSMSSQDIPCFLITHGWKDYFDVVVLSSVIKVRKPAPEPFLKAVRALKTEPGYCAFVGNRISKDIVGCKRAGFGMGIMLESTGKTGPEEKDQNKFPDAVIHSLSDLLGIFPQRA